MPRILLAALALAILGCAETDDPKPPKKARGGGTEPKVKGKRVNVGQNVWLEILPGNKKRVLVSAEVCLRKGALELLLTRRRMKDHEAILTADADARIIHTALETAGARHGKPVSFSPRFEPASGGRIAIELHYTDKDGKAHEIPATHWIRNMKTGKELDLDAWIFGGSVLAADPGDPKGPLRYYANDGQLIAIANVDVAMLDVPFPSPKAIDDRGFEAWHERIPPLGTKVVVVMTPLLE